MSSEEIYIKDELVSPDWMDKDFFEMVLRQSEEDSQLKVSETVLTSHLQNTNLLYSPRFQLLRLSQLLEKMITFPASFTELRSITQNQQISQKLNQLF